MSKKPRGVQIELPTEMEPLVEKLRTDTLATTNAEVIRRAIRFYDFFRREAEKGNSIEVVDKDGVRTKLYIL